MGVNYVDSDAEEWQEFAVHFITYHADFNDSVCGTDTDCSLSVYKEGEG